MEHNKAVKKNEVDLYVLIRNAYSPIQYYQVTKAHKLGMIANGYRISFWIDENTLKLILMMVAQLFEYTKNH